MASPLVFINKLYKTSDFWSRDMLHSDFLENDLGLVPPFCFVHDFSRKIFFMLYSINRWTYYINISINNFINMLYPNFNDWLPLLLEKLGNMGFP